MAYDIGPKIGIDGEAEFRKTINNINASIKVLGSEMKLVTATYEENANSMEALSAKNDVLDRSLEQQEKHLQAVTDMLEKAAEKYGENSTEAQKWQRAVNESKTALQKTKNEINDVRREMEKLDEETEDAADAFEELGDSAEKTGGRLDVMKVAAGNLLSGGVSALLGGIQDAASELVNLDKITEEYRINQGKLEAAYTANGKSAELAKTAYKELYKVLGDSDQATEAAQLMQSLAESEEDVSDWAKIAAGAVAKWGDALPVENLIETAQEAIATGEAIGGGLSDAIAWSGKNVDEFNARLAECTTEEERNRLVTEELTKLLGPYADAFYETNDAVIKARDAQLQMDDATGRLGEAVGRVKDSLIEQFGPTLSNAAEWAADFIEGIDTEGLEQKFADAWAGIKADWEDMKPFFDGVGQTIKKALNAWGDSIENSQAYKTQQYAREWQEKARAERNGTESENQQTGGGLSAEDIAAAVEKGVRGGWSGASVVMDTGKAVGQITTAQRNQQIAYGRSSGGPGY